MDKITCVGQKGFSSSKYCQEVLIDVIDSISAINKKKKNGVLLSLDIKKAFDSTSHSYLQMAYQFFNFGPNFIKWLNLIGTNRKACIILGNGMYSEFFDLERGNAQGDTTSPYIFNIGFQILLLRLTFDLQIDGVVEFPTVPGDIPPLPPTVGTYTRKVSAFADDASVIVKYTYENLLHIKNVLEDFGNLSGLVCNVEKTVILPIGNNVIIDDRIATLGFQPADKLTILGLEINNMGFTEKNFDNIVQKIRSQVGAWRPYNLSLPGRINIAKTMLYSQINYLGCFLPMPVETIRIIDGLITDYVKGNLNIAKRRLYLPPDQGGLGLFDIQDFLDAQKCSWIKRSVNLNERWKVILYISNFGCIFNAKERNVNVTESPICRQICASYERFCNFFTAVDENFQKMFIFENSKISIDIEGREPVSRTLFLQDTFRLHASKLYQLRYGDLFDEEDNFLSMARICDITDVDFNPLQIFQLRNACWVARTRYAKKDPTEQKSVQIETFLFRRKKGSNHIRKVLSSKSNNGIPHNMRKFADNLDIVITGEQ
jgi:hypothetical protein